MPTRDHTIRFMANNLAIRSSDNYTKSSEVSGYPFTNCQNSKRAQYWKPKGLFVIDSTNNKLYINDGSDKTITIVSNSYIGPAQLAAQLQLELNGASSGWTVTYSTTTYKFTISRSGSATLRFSQTTNSVWDTIGFTGAIDTTATTWTADQIRIHTSEFVRWDLTTSRPVTFFAMICPINEDFALSQTATIKIQANNLDVWTAPPLDETLTTTENGVFRFFDDLDDYTYRYWRLEIIDVDNPLGPEGIHISHIYLGDHVTFSDNRTVGFGYDFGVVDPTVLTEAESGTMYFDTKPKYSTFKNLGLDLLKREHKDDLLTLYKRVGKSVPFYMSIDPLLTYTDSLDELTKFVHFSEEPRFRHVMRDLFSSNVGFREVI